MIRLLTVFLSAALLMACEANVRGPSVELDIPKIKVFDSPGFCPPGQARKGNC